MRLPNTVKQIGAGAFADNSISSISLPELDDETGKVFVGWEDENGSSITEITDFSLAYDAVFDISTSEISNSLEKDIIVYPNPASQFVNIKLKGNYSIQLIDMLDKVVYQNDFVQYSIQIPVAHFTPGVYILKIEKENTVTTIRVVIQ